MNVTKWKRGLTTKRNLGKQLKDYRLKYGITQEAVAKIIGCSPSTLSVLECGKFGSFELIESYAWALGLDLKELVTALK